MSLIERIKKIKARLSNPCSRDDCSVEIHDTADVADILRETGIDRKKYRIATSGYSFAQAGYEDVTLKFLKHLDKCLGSKNVGYITPPTLYPGSIYDITASISGLKPRNVAFFTTERYWKGTDLSSFNEDVNMKQFREASIHIFPDNQTYLEATANASNVLVCTGGKKVAVNEIVEALKRNHTVIMLVNENLKNDDFDKNNNSVENAPRYFNNFIVNCGVDPANIKDLDLEFLNENQGKVLQLVKWYFVNDDDSIKSAAERAAQVLKTQNIFEIIEDNNCMTKKEKERASKSFSTQVGDAFIRSKNMRI